MRREAATVLAANLAFAERRGTSSHGFVRTTIYFERMAAGGIVASALPAVATRSGATAVVDCHDGPGAVGAMAATELAAELAGEHGVGLVAGRNANHFGAAGFYAEVLAERGLLGVALCNTDVVMAPPDGGKRVLGTNPLAIATPTRTPEGVRPLLDMATSHVAYGKLIVAEKAGEQIPLGWAVDVDGKPTTDARAGLDGAILPAAGPKGFGLAFMIDVFAVLGGAEPSPDVGAFYGDRAAPQRLGFTIVAVDPSVLAGADVFDRRVRRLSKHVQEGGVEGQPPPMVPGEPEQRREDAGQSMISAEVVNELTALGDRLSIPFPRES